MPRRGCSSIRRRPRARHCSSALVDVRAAVGGVVEARAPLGEELARRRVVAERAQQLDVRVADAQQHRLDTLLGDRLAVLDRHAERSL